MTANCPCAGYREGAPPRIFDRATLPPLNPRSSSCEFLAASFARRSTAFRIGDFLPFLHWRSVLSRVLWRTARRRFHRSEFSTGRPEEFLHPLLLHPGARLKLSKAYKESVMIMTRWTRKA